MKSVIRSRSLLRFIVAPAVLVLAAEPLAAQVIRLSAPLPPGGELEVFEVSADGRHVLYTGEQIFDGVSELFSVRPGPYPAPIRLSGDLVAGGDVDRSHVKATPDATRVVYLADQDTDQVRELYSAPLDGSAAAIKLNGPLGPSGQVRSFRIAADSQRVVYRAGPTASGNFELHSVRTDGSTSPVRLDTDPVSGGMVLQYAISPDGARVVYTADRDVDEQVELFSVPIDGSAAAVKLNGALPPGGDVGWIAFRPDSGAVAYTARETLADRTHVYVVPVDGSVARVQVSGSVAVDTNVSSLAFSPDGLRVLYAQLPEQELYTAPADGSLAPTLVSGAETAEVYEPVAFSPDGTRVLYVGWLHPRRRLFVAPVDGSAQGVQLTNEEDFDHSGQEPSILVTSSGQAVFPAFVGIQRAVLSVPIDGSTAPVRLTPQELRPLGFRLTADELHLVFTAYVVFSGGTTALYGAPLDGSQASTLLAGDARADVGAFALVPGSDRIVFRAARHVYLTWLRPERVPRSSVR